MIGRSRASAEPGRGRGAASKEWSTIATTTPAVSAQAAPRPAGYAGGEVLAGGVANLGRVRRFGNTVQRPMAPRSPATHALLAHLHDRRFGAAPRVLRAGGRVEVLSWVPGRAARTPLPEWARGDDSLVSVAGLLRRFHMAVADFDPDPFEWPAEQVPDGYRDRTVSHNDVHPGNLVFDGSRAVGLIDFDLAGPGSRIWDLAAAARCWCPLLADEDVPAELRGRRYARFRLLLDAYGVEGADRGAVARAALANHEWTFQIVAREIERGHEGFRQYWDAVGARAARARRWLRDNSAQLLAEAG